MNKYDPHALEAETIINPRQYLHAAAYRGR